MTEEQYVLPIKVKITAEAPDDVVRTIAEVIYDAVNAFTKEPDFNKKVKLFDMDYSLHKKMSD